MSHILAEAGLCGHWGCPMTVHFLFWFLTSEAPISKWCHIKPHSALWGEIAAQYGEAKNNNGTCMDVIRESWRRNPRPSVAHLLCSSSLLSPHHSPPRQVALWPSTLHKWTLRPRNWVSIPGLSPFPRSSPLVKDRASDLCFPYL